MDISGIRKVWSDKQRKRGAATLRLMGEQEVERCTKWLRENADRYSFTEALAVLKIGDTKLRAMEKTIEVYCLRQSRGYGDDVNPIMGEWLRKPWGSCVADSQSA